MSPPLVKAAALPPGLSAPVGHYSHATVSNGLIFVSGLFLVLKLAAFTLNIRPLAGLWWFYSEWSWASFGLVSSNCLRCSACWSLICCSAEPLAWGSSGLACLRRSA